MGSFANYAWGQTGKAVVARLNSGTDIVEGIEKVCRDNDIDAASISVVIGSLSRANFTFVVPLPDRKLKAGKGEPLIIQGPLDVLGGQGTVAKTEDGEYFIHLHAVLADKLDHTYGGHLTKGENPVLLTAEVVLTELKGVKLLRRYYEETDSQQLSPEN